MSAILSEPKTSTSATVFIGGATPLTLDFGSFLKKMSDDEFFDFCMLNQDLRIEMTAEGDLIIMPPTGGKTGNRNFNLVGEFSAWSKKDGTGKGFDSSTFFRLPNGAKRSPDLVWVRNERWDVLTDVEKEKFPPICPDFVVELRSKNRFTEKTARENDGIY